MAITKADGIGKGGGINGGINGGIESLLAFIENNPGKRIKAIAQEMDVPIRTIERWVKKLREEGKVEFRGGKRTGGYYSVS